MNLIIIYQLKSDEQIVTTLQGLLIARNHIVTINKIRQDQNLINFVQELNLEKADRLLLFSVDKNIAKLLNFLMDKRTLIVINNRKFLNDYIQENLISDENYMFIIDKELGHKDNKSSIFNYTNENDLITKFERVKLPKKDNASAINPFTPIFYKLLIYKIKVALIRMKRKYKKK